MISFNKIQKDARLVRQAVETGQYRKLAQAGAVLTMDMLLWGGGVLAAMAFVLYLKNSGWPAIQGWMEASAVSANMKKINDIFSGAAGYTGLDNTAVANQTVFQPKYLPGGAVIQNRFGGLVTVGFTTVNANNDTLMYTNTLIPSSACAAMVNQLADDMDRVSVGGVVVKNLNSAVNPATLNTQCIAGNAATILAEKIKQS